jgi:hypothetical protein
MMRLLSDIGNLAVSRGASLFTKEEFVLGVFRELSLYKTNARLKHGVSSLVVGSSGVCLRHGQRRPSAEVSDWDQCFVLCLFVETSVGDVVLSALVDLLFALLLVIMWVLVVPFPILLPLLHRT